MSREFGTDLNGYSVLGYPDSEPMPENNPIKDLRESDDYFYKIISPAIGKSGHTDPALVARLEYRELCRLELLQDRDSTTLRDKFNEADEIVWRYRISATVGQIALAA